MCHTDFDIFGSAFFLNHCISSFLSLPHSILSILGGERLFNVFFPCLASRTVFGRASIPGVKEYSYLKMLVARSLSDAGKCSFRSTAGGGGGGGRGGEDKSPPSPWPCWVGENF